MELQELDWAGWMALPAADTLALTVNNRLARRLIADMAATLGPQQRVAELPRIVPLSVWLVDMADQLGFGGQVPLAAWRLDSFATQRLWERVIAQAEHDRPLLDFGQTARLAADADALMDEWDLAVAPAEATHEYTRFACWREAYVRQLAALDAEDAGRSAARVIDALSLDEAVPVPAHVVLAGFNEYSPRQQAMLAALAARGAQLWQLHADSAERVETSQLRRFAAADPQTEWRMAVAWAAERLRTDPQGRYAIVAAHLESDAPLARRLLEQALAARPGQSALPYNVAVGRPLDEWPVVRAALAWLETLATFAENATCPVPVLGQALLLGQVTGDRSAQAGMVEIDVRQRRSGEVTVTQARWLERLQGANPALAQAWQQALAIWVDQGAGTAAQDWAARWRAALGLLGFPGDASLDSVGFQACEALSAALDRFAALSVLEPELEGTVALRLWQRMLTNTPFQPQRAPDARLDVLGLLEAEGGRWDGVWVLGLVDEVLPDMPSPNPLLPAQVLRQAGAPRATVDRERIWAEQMYAALCRTAPDIMFSHARRDGEREMRPAPLIAALPLAGCDWPVPAVPAALPQETLVDEQGPALALWQPEAGEAGVMRGGLDVLELQSRNPQWAFLRHRLGGRSLASYAQPGGALSRGQFLHGVMEALWKVLGSQDRLHQAMAEHRLEALVAEAAEQAARQYLDDALPAERELEKARACGIALRWLDLDAQREPFRIDGVEQAHVWRRGPLSLRVRLDRIDQVDEGRLVVDYKTGSSVAEPGRDWTRLRPVELQLPFYASVVGGVSGLMLAQLHARKVAAKGIAEHDMGVAGLAYLPDWQWPDAVPGMFMDDSPAGPAPQDWPALLLRWRTAIERLADEYAAGWAVNRAWHGADLRYCDAAAFLRLDLEDWQAEEDEA